MYKRLFGQCGNKISCTRSTDDDIFEVQDDQYFKRNEIMQLTMRKLYPKYQQEKIKIFFQKELALFEAGKRKFFLRC